MHVADQRPEHARRAGYHLTDPQARSEFGYRPSSLVNSETPLREPSVYAAVGGMPFLEALVDRFHEGVEHDPVLRGRAGTLAGKTAA